MRSLLESETHEKQCSGGKDNDKTVLYFITMKVFTIPLPFERQPRDQKAKACRPLMHTF